MKTLFLLSDKALLMNHNYITQSQAIKFYNNEKLKNEYFVDFLIRNNFYIM